jgi:hypothetical protein
MKEFIYVKRRYEAGRDTGKLFELITWCLQQKLSTQAQDEIDRLLRLNPSEDVAEKARELQRKLE